MPISLLYNIFIPLLFSLHNETLSSCEAKNKLIFLLFHLINTNTFRFPSPRENLSSLCKQNQLKFLGKLGNTNRIKNNIYEFVYNDPTKCYYVIPVNSHNIKKNKKK